MNSGLRYLDCSYNRIGREGLQSLADSLKEFKKLEYIGLAQNGLKTYEDVEPLFNYIGKKEIAGEDLDRYMEVKTEID